MSETYIIIHDDSYDGSKYVEHENLSKSEVIDYLANRYVDSGLSERILRERRVIETNNDSPDARKFVRGSEFSEICKTKIDRKEIERKKHAEDCEKSAVQWRYRRYLELKETFEGKDPPDGVAE